MQNRLLWRFFLLFSSNLVRTRPGSEFKEYFFSLQPFVDGPAKFGVLALTVISCLCLLQSKRRKLGSVLLFVSANLMAYSAPGHVIAYSIISYGLLGYTFASILNLAPYERWRVTGAASAVPYFLAGVSKLASSGLEWINPWYAGLFLNFADFRHKLNLGSFNPPDSLVDYFSQPSYFGSSLLATALITELISVFLFLNPRTARFGVAGVLIAHMGMLTFVNVLWPPLIFYWIVLGITAPETDSNSSPETKTFSKILLPALVAILIALSFTLPKGRFNATTLIYPFSGFRMYSRPQKYMRHYFLTSLENVVLKNAELVTDFGATTQGINVLIHQLAFDDMSAEEESAILCREIRPKSRKGFAIRVFELKFNTQLNRIEKAGRKVAECLPTQ